MDGINVPDAFDGIVTLDFHGIPRDFPYILQDGIKRVCAVLPGQPKYGAMPQFSAAEEVITKDDLEAYKSMGVDLDISPDLEILDQEQENACGAFSGTTTFGVSWTLAGYPYYQWSENALYALVNGGADAGCSPLDVLRALLKHGIPRKEANPTNTMFLQDIPQSTWADAMNFRLAAGYECSSWNQIITAIVLGYAVEFGIALPGGFAHPDAYGIPPVGGFAGLHAMNGCGLKWFEHLREWCLKVRNSWGVRYGLGGIIYLREAHFDRSAAMGYVEAYAAKAPMPSTAGGDPPPALVLAGSPGANWSKSAA